jgi:thiol-disulfide isomerase/thioredoxin
MRRSIFVFPVVALLAGCYEVSPSGSPPDAAEVADVGGGTRSGAMTGSDQTQVGLQILDWDGLQRLIDSQRGKVVVLDCWSTSCAPCIREFPDLVALQRKHSRDKLACISLSFDYEGIGRPEDERERVLAFLKKQDATFANVLSSLDSDALTAKLEIPAIPAVFVYDRHGQLQKRFDNRYASRDGGPFTYKQVSALVEELLAAPSGRTE